MERDVFLLLHFVMLIKEHKLNAEILREIAERIFVGEPITQIQDRAKRKNVVKQPLQQMINVKNFWTLVLRMELLVYQKLMPVQHIKVQVTNVLNLLEMEYNVTRKIPALTDYVLI